ncbi:MAG: hypothetical protein ABIS01_04110, partial [Ferruginibacter sp.]
MMTDLGNIKRIAGEKEAENDAFRAFLGQKDEKDTDILVYNLNAEITPQIDCTACGNCCTSLVSVTAEEIKSLSTHLEISP